MTERETSLSSLQTECFQFKSFRVQQRDATMKVGTDAILLGAWATYPMPSSVLDIGTGTGVVALMLAQRYLNATIDAVEIDGPSYELAAGNFSNSPWAGRLTVQKNSVQSFSPGSGFDLVVANPPWFQDSLKPPDVARRIARHTDSLSLQDLAVAAHRLLNERGRLSVILPTLQADAFVYHAAQNGLSLTRRCYVKPTPQQSPKRQLMEFSRHTSSAEPETDELVVELRRHHYSPAFEQLAKDFLLKL